MAVQWGAAQCGSSLVLEFTFTADDQLATVPVDSAAAGKNHVCQLPNLFAHLLRDWQHAKMPWKRRIYNKASDLTAFTDMIPWFGQAIDGADASSP
jgi:hypothetical protein